MKLLKVLTEKIHRATAPKMPTTEGQPLTPEVLRTLADQLEQRQREVSGDGKAEFLEDMTEEEYAIHLIEEDHGWKEFRDKIFGRTPKLPMVHGAVLLDDDPTNEA